MTHSTAHPLFTTPSFPWLFPSIPTRLLSSISLLKARIIVDSGVTCSFGHLATSPSGMMLVSTKAGMTQFSAMFSCFNCAGGEERTSPTQPCYAAAYYGLVKKGYCTTMEAVMTIFGLNGVLLVVLERSRRVLRAKWIKSFRP